MELKSQWTEEIFIYYFFFLDQTRFKKTTIYEQNYNKLHCTTKKKNSSLYFANNSFYWGGGVFQLGGRHFQTNNNFSRKLREILEQLRKPNGGNTSLGENLRSALEAFNRKRKTTQNWNCFCQLKLSSMVN